MSEITSELGGPTGLRRLDSVQELRTFPDGTVVVWYSPIFPEHERQAGVLVTASDGSREIRPISIYVYEGNSDLTDVTAPLWVLTFDDPPGGIDLFAAFGIADVSSEPQPFGGDAAHHELRPPIDDAARSEDH